MRRGLDDAGHEGVKILVSGGMTPERIATFVEAEAVVDGFGVGSHISGARAVDFTAALVRVAKVLGYRVTVCDAREVFATRQRFPLADEVVVDWPNRLLDQVGPGLGQRDAVCVLTHDNKFDVPAIVSALATGVASLP